MHIFVWLILFAPTAMSYSFDGQLDHFVSLIIDEMKAVEGLRLPDVRQNYKMSRFFLPVTITIKCSGGVTSVPEKVTRGNPSVVEVIRANVTRIQTFILASSSRFSYTSCAMTTDSMFIPRRDNPMDGVLNNFSFHMALRLEHGHPVCKAYLERLTIGDLGHLGIDVLEKNLPSSVSKFLLKMIQNTFSDIISHAIDTAVADTIKAVSRKHDLCEIFPITY